MGDVKAAQRYFSKAETASDATNQEVKCRNLMNKWVPDGYTSEYFQSKSLFALQYFLREKGIRDRSIWLELNCFQFCAV